MGEPEGKKTGVADAQHGAWSMGGKWKDHASLRGAVCAVECAATSMFGHGEQKKGKGGKEEGAGNRAKRGRNRRVKEEKTLNSEKRMNLHVKKNRDDSEDRRMRVVAWGGQKREET